MKLVLVVIGVVGAVVTHAGAGVTQFLATDGSRLHVADSSGVVQPVVILSAAVQSLTVVPDGYSIPGAVSGDIIAAARNATGGQYAVYRLDDPLGAATLTQIGATSSSFGSFAFANGGLYAVHDAQSPIRVYELSTTNFATVQSWSTGVSVTGGGGLAFDNVGGRFLFTDYTNNRLMSWTPGNAATLIGPVGFGFTNNGIEFHQGGLYGALRPDSPQTELRIGQFDLSSGAFTTIVTVPNIVGDGTGFIAVPAPGTLIALGAVPLTSLRRRKAPLA